MHMYVCTYVLRYVCTSYVCNIYIIRSLDLYLGMRQVKIDWNSSCIEPQCGNKFGPSIQHSPWLNKISGSFLQYLNQPSCFKEATPTSAAHWELFQLFAALCKLLFF